MNSIPMKIRGMKLLIEDEKNNISYCDSIINDESIPDTKMIKRNAKRDKLMSLRAIEAAEFYIKEHTKETEK